MTVRRLLRALPGLSAWRQLARDHLQLVDDYHALERAYRSLEDEHRRLGRERLALEERLERLASPWFSPPPGEPAEVGGVPVPPPLLRFWVAGHEDLGWFLQAGEAAAASLAESLARCGVDAAGLGAVLDFGCGCGRVLRHLPAVTGARLYGTDVNAEAIAWSRANLGLAEFAANGLAPPLAYPDASFDLAYALSVFTHLDGDLQRAWLAELRRVLRPGGLLLISLHGDSYRGELSDAERRAYDAGEMVVQRNDLLGHNRCGAFHPPAYVRSRLAPGFTVLDHQPDGARGNPHQDLYLLRADAERPGAPGAVLQ